MGRLGKGISSYFRNMIMQMGKYDTFPSVLTLSERICHFSKIGTDGAASPETLGQPLLLSPAGIKRPAGFAPGRSF